MPRHVTAEGKFSTYELPKYYNHREMNERGKRSSDYEAETVHLMLPFNGIDHHVELTPYHEFISPHMVIETRGPGIEKSLNEGLRFARASDDQCHYRGHVRGHPNSRAALSLCDGVVSRCFDVLQKIASFLLFFLVINLLSLEHIDRSILNATIHDFRSLAENDTLKTYQKFTERIFF